MKTLLTLLSLTICFSIKAQNIPISDSLVHKMSIAQPKNYEENEKTILILTEEISNYSQEISNSIKGETALSVLYANLDEDTDIELIVFVGFYSWSNFLVFNKVGKQYFLVYRERIYLDSNQSLLYEINPSDGNPLIWVKYYNGHGTGEYKDTYFFYRFTTKGFKKVLTLAGRYFLHSGSILSLNLEANTTTFRSHMNGSFSVVMGYNYYLPYYLNDKKRKEITLLKKALMFQFKWNEEDQKYQPWFYEDNFSNEQKLFLISQEVDKKLFIKLFRVELYEMRKNLSEEELSILDEWLES